MGDKICSIIKHLTEDIGGEGGIFLSLQKMPVNQGFRSCLLTLCVPVECPLCRDLGLVEHTYPNTLLALAGLTLRVSEGKSGQRPEIAHAAAFGRF